LIGKKAEDGLPGASGSVDAPKRRKERGLGTDVLKKRLGELLGINSKLSGRREKQK